MIRLRNLDISRIERELQRLNKSLGWTEPLPAYRPSFGIKHFAFEDFANAMLAILGTREGVQSIQQLTGGCSEAMCDSEQSVQPDSLPAKLNGADRRAM